MSTNNHNNQKLNILVVEDHFINQELMAEVLDSLDCNVDTAENGKVALDYVKSKEYDLIFMDLQMPEMDGYAATQEMRKIEIKIPIVALTASIISDKRKCLEVGMNDYLPKPFEVSDIEKVISKYFPER